MVIGIGLDIVETARVVRLLERYDQAIVRKLMDPEESSLLPAAPAERAQALALAIAAKEAASKALGTGWSGGVRWRDVVVTLSPPELRLHGAAGDVARRLGSSGRTRLQLELRGPLALAQVWLLR